MSKGMYTKGILGSFWNNGGLKAHGMYNGPKIAKLTKNVFFHRFYAWTYFRKWPKL